MLADLLVPAQCPQDGHRIARGGLTYKDQSPADFGNGLVVVLIRKPSVVDKVVEDSPHRPLRRLRDIPSDLRVGVVLVRKSRVADPDHVGVVRACALLFSYLSLVFYVTDTCYRARSPLSAWPVTANESKYPPKIPYRYRILAPSCSPNGASPCAENTPPGPPTLAELMAVVIPSKLTSAKYKPFVTAPGLIWEMLTNTSRMSEMADRIEAPAMQCSPRIMPVLLSMQGEKEVERGRLGCEGAGVEGVWKS